MNTTAQLAAIDAWLADRPAREYVWDEGSEQRMSQVAESWDYETGRASLMPTKRRWSA